MAKKSPVHSTAKKANSKNPAIKRVGAKHPNGKNRSDLSAPPGNEGDFLTTNQGLRVSDNHNSLKAGPRGPALLEDFWLREKITHFDHERIPERVVHARGVAAFGTFECTEDLSKFTNAGFLTHKGKKTPVVTRFSTVAGSRGSADTARDVRGFAVKFYTDEGNFDMVGNNIPVFFIHDALKFPDLIHAAKPEPNHEIPQAATAHDTFWDFVSLMPESTHMLFWIMSDRAIPRSLRMMEGFGVHTFRLVNAQGKGTFVKFHWKPKLGVHSVTWEESLNLAGQDPDFHRRDLFDAIDAGAFPEWDLGMQLIPEEDEFKYPFDLLDPTKLVPEEMVPVRRVGTLTLNRNPDNYFTEVEQLAFHPGSLVPGIDVTNDPLLQGRLFSYTDTQLIRLGGPNFHELPVNRPLAPVNNHQRDGFGRQAINPGKVAYEPNSLGGGCPFHAGANMKSFVSYTERLDGHKVRARSTSFDDHFSQAKLFFNSQTPTEQEHIKNSFSFELSKVETMAIRERMIGALMNVDEALAKKVAANVGVKFPIDSTVQPNAANPENNIVPENRATETALSDEHYPKPKVKLVTNAPTLSMGRMLKPSMETRKVAILVSESSDAKALTEVVTRIEKEGATVELIAQILGPVGKTKFEAHKTFDNSTSLHYDAVWVAEGAKELLTLGLARRFVLQAFKHCKTIGGAGSGADLCQRAIQSQMEFETEKPKGGTIIDKGVVLGTDSKSGIKSFLASASGHRVWAREAKVKTMAI
jgi:catalase